MENVDKILIQLISMLSMPPNQIHNFHQHMMSTVEVHSREKRVPEKAPNQYYNACVEVSYRHPAHPVYPEALSKNCMQFQNDQSLYFYNHHLIPGTYTYRKVYSLPQEFSRDSVLQQHRL